MPGDNKLEGMTIIVGNFTTHEEIRQLLGHHGTWIRHMEARHQTWWPGIGREYEWGRSKSHWQGEARLGGPAAGDGEEVVDN